MLEHSSCCVDTETENFQQKSSVSCGLGKGYQAPWRLGLEAGRMPSSGLSSDMASECISQRAL